MAHSLGIRSLVLLMVACHIYSTPLKKNKGDVCDPLPEIEHGQYLPKGYSLNHGNQVRIKCNVGYKFNGRILSRTCQTNNKWSEIQGKCINVNNVFCKPFITRKNVVLSKVQQTWAYGESVSLRCIGGFTYNGSKVRTCLINSMWSGDEGDCIPVSCVQLPRIEHGDYEPANYKINFGSHVSIVCNDGYNYTGVSSIRTCQNDNSWSGGHGKCVDINDVVCKLSTNDSDLLPPQKVNWKYDESIRMICKEGYKYNGTALRQCLINGTWSGEDGVCMRVHCGPHDRIHHGFANMTGEFFTDVARFSCESGYTLDGPSESICERSGMWSVSGKCIMINMSSSKAENRVLMLVLVITISIVIGLVVLGIILFFVLKNRKRDTRGRDKTAESKEDGTELLPMLSQDVTKQEQMNEENRNAIINRGHEIGRGTDKRISLEQTFIELRMVVHSGSEEKPLMADKISYEQYASILEKIEQEMVATDDMLKESDDMFLLLRGRAGVGKTTVLNKLMFDWAKKEKEWTKQYVIAVLFNSRHLSNMLDWQTNYPKGFSLKDFLQQCSQYNVTLPEGWEDEDKILVCIDGLDEFQYLLTRFKDDLDSSTSIAAPYQWCIKILKRQVLPHSTLVVASRHFKGLKVLKATKTIDVVGLTKEKVNEYINLHVSDENKTMVQNTIMLNNPILLSVCTITFCCMMLCRALDMNGHDDVDEDLYSYTRITAFIFKNLLERNSTGSGHSIAEINSCIQKLSKLACGGLLKKTEETGVIQLVFSQEDIQKAGLTRKDVDVGVLLGLIINCDMSYTSSGAGSVYMEFIHLSIQEMLAMAYLLTEDEQSIKHSLEKMWKSQVFNGFALQHLFGLCYDSHHTVTDLMEKVLPKAVKKPLKLKNILYGILSNKKPNRYERLCAIQMAYESHDPKIAEKVVELIYGNEPTMKYTNVHLTAVDLNGIFFAANHSTNICKLVLHGIKPDDSCLEDLARILAKDQKITDIAFEGRRISEEGLNHLLSALKENNKIKSLSLEGTSLDNQKMKVITEFLATNNTVETIHLARNNITKESIQSLCYARQNNNSPLTVKCDQELFQEMVNEPEANKNWNENISIVSTY